LCAAAARSQHVLEVSHSDEVGEDAVLSVFAQLGLDEQQARPLMEVVRSKGKADIIQGDERSCLAAQSAFEAIGMQASARPLAAAASAGARPASEYSNSDVIEADAASLQELASDPKGGALVTFYAPWCGHCIKMVPEFKKAASMLKRTGVRAAAVNSDDNPGLAKSLGIRGFPTVRWVYAGEWTEYKQQRTAMEMVQWATQQATVSKLKHHLGGAVKGAKLAMSKVLGKVMPGGTAVGMGRAATPQAAAVAA